MKPPPTPGLRAAGAPSRDLAPHVRAAVAQARMAPQQARPLAAHVAAAIHRPAMAFSQPSSAPAVQGKPASPLAGRIAVPSRAPHVQAAIRAGASRPGAVQGFRAAPPPARWGGAGVAQAMRKRGLNHDDEANQPNKEIKLVPSEEESGLQQEFVQKRKLPWEVLRWIVELAVGSARVNDLPFVLDPRQAMNLRLVCKRFLFRIQELGFNAEALRSARPPDSMFARLAEESFLDHFPAFKAMATIVRESFPPDVFAYVALGRSATPLLGVLARTCSNAVLINMPMGQISITMAQDQAEWLKLEKNRKNLFAHFDLFVAPDKLRGRSKVLVLDYGDYGKALYTVYHWLNAYYASKNVTIEVMIYSISKETPQALKEDPGEELGEDVRPLPRKHLAIAGPDITGIGPLIDDLFGGELKKLGIDLYESLATGDILTKGTKPSTPSLANFYRLLRMLAEAGL